MEGSRQVRKLPCSAELRQTWSFPARCPLWGVEATTLRLRGGPSRPECPLLATPSDSLLPLEGETGRAPARPSSVPGVTTVGECGLFFSC